MKAILSCVFLASIALGQEIDVCISNPCEHDGTCTPDGSGGFTCQCQPGFSEEFGCSLIYGEFCLSNPCFNGGTCDEFAEECVCREGWSGQMCDEPENIDTVCLSNPCQNGGICSVDAPSDFSCACLSIFEGSRCESFTGTGLELLPNETGCCLSQPCLYDGTCSEDGFGFSCSCVEGYSGYTCETIDDGVCASNPCEHGGTCVPVGTTDFRCICDDRFSGSRCQMFDQGVCLSDPCIYGTCNATADGDFECICLEGFTGLSCQIIGVDRCPESDLGPDGSGPTLKANFLILCFSLWLYFLCE